MVHLIARFLHAGSIRAVFSISRRSPDSPAGGRPSAIPSPPLPFSTFVCLGETKSITRNQTCIAVSAGSLRRSLTARLLLIRSRMVCAGQPRESFQPDMAGPWLIAPDDG